MMGNGTRITSPKHQCEKTYLVTLADPVENHYALACEESILLRGEKRTDKLKQNLKC